MHLCLLASIRTFIQKTVNPVIPRLSSRAISVNVNLPWPCERQSRNPIFHLPPPNLCRRHQTPHILYINRRLLIPTSMFLDPILQATSQDLPLDEEIKWDRLSTFFGSIVEHLVDQFGELISLPLGWEEVGGWWDGEGGVSSEQVDR